MKKVVIGGTTYFCFEPGEEELKKEFRSTLTELNLASKAFEVAVNSMIEKGYSLETYKAFSEQYLKAGELHNDAARKVKRLILDEEPSLHGSSLMAYDSLVEGVTCKIQELKTL